MFSKGHFVIGDVNFTAERISEDISLFQTYIQVTSSNASKYKQLSRNICTTFNR